MGLGTLNNRGPEALKDFALIDIEGRAERSSPFTKLAIYTHGSTHPQERGRFSVFMTFWHRQFKKYVPETPWTGDTLLLCKAEQTNRMLVFIKKEVRGI